MYTYKYEIACELVLLITLESFFPLTDTFLTASQVAHDVRVVCDLCTSVPDTLLFVWPSARNCMHLREVTPDKEHSVTQH